MDWKLFTTVFTTMFIAEFGDKTQLAAFTLSAGSKNTTTVLIASGLALILVTTIGVFTGRIVGSIIPERYINYISGGLFIIIGLVTLFKNNL